MPEPLQIVGGGMAGLRLGIGLRMADVPVVLWEAAQYPKHRVCGEFISGRGLESLTTAELTRPLQNAGAVSAISAAFYDDHAHSALLKLPEAALCISRYQTDKLMAERFVELGGILHANQRWNGQYNEGIIRATGRRPSHKANGRRLFGLKIHAQNVSLKADLEMHFIESGYVGICRIENGLVNICGLFQSNRAIPNLGQNWKEWLLGPQNSELGRRLENATFDLDSFCSVAGLSLSAQKASDHNECCIGDSLTMIPPLTGNGMSMALESAALAVNPLREYYFGKQSWAEAKRQVAADCDAVFSNRLRFAGMIQKALFSHTARKLLIATASKSETLRKWFFKQTR